MGGEWLFLIRPTPELSMRTWQDELVKIKKQFQGVHGLEPGTTAVFSDVTSLGGENNVFARFTYEGPCRHGDDSGMWCLPWDPTKPLPDGHIHARCAPDNFKRYSYEIQRYLENAFPHSILIEWGDGLDGYSGRLLRSVGFKSLSLECRGCGKLPPVDISHLLGDMRTQLGLNLFHAIENQDERLVLLLMGDARLDIDFISTFGHPCEENVAPQKWDRGGRSHRTYVREVSAVRLAVEKLVLSPNQVDHPEVGSQLRILRMILSKGPKLDFPDFHKRQSETRDLSRNVVFDVVGYDHADFDTPASFAPLQTGGAEVRIRMTLLSMLLPLVKRPPPQSCLANLMGLKSTELISENDGYMAYREGHFDESLRRLLDNGRNIDYILNKLPGWELVKALQEFEDEDWPESEFMHWCEHDGLEMTFFKDVDAQLAAQAFQGTNEISARELISRRRVLQGIVNPCARCGATSPAIKRCGQCKRVFYCSKECQTSHWAEHKPSCRGGSSQSSCG